MSTQPTQTPQEKAYLALMRGLRELDLQCSSVPCHLVLIGDHAFPLAMNSKGQVLMAASLYGRGRIVVLGHETYLTKLPDLVKNAVTWLRGDGCDNLSVAIHNNVRAVANNLPGSSFQVEVVGSFSKDLSAGVYVTDAYSMGADATALVAFLKAGGGVLMAGQAWNWAAHHPTENTLLQFEGNKVSGVAGIYFSAQYGEAECLPVYPVIPSSWMAVRTGKDFKDDLEFLLQGISEFDLRGDWILSDILVHGSLAFPIGTTDDGKVFLAGAYYGQGRVIVISHEGFLSRETLAPFWTNALHWLDEGQQGVVGVEPEISLNALSKSGLKCKKTKFRKDLSVYVRTAYSDDYAEEIREFVAEGGGLLIGGHSWYWSYSNAEKNILTEFPGNKILTKMGLSLLPETICGGLFKAPKPSQAMKDRALSGMTLEWRRAERTGKDFKDDLEFLLQGISEFDLRGDWILSNTLVQSSLAFPIGTTDDGKVFLAGAYYGQGRVIVISHEGFLSRETLAPFWTNALHWLDEGQQGVVGVEPEISLNALSKSGLKCKKTKFRKDLSVYVRTAYSDDYAEEIREFVAEGGGLLIGGHSWYWSYSNAEKNILTDFPGNKILTKMGLSLLPETICGGLFKAPKPSQAMKDTYHFRNLLHRFAAHEMMGQELSEQEKQYLKKLGKDCADYLHIKAHDCFSYAQIVSILTDILKRSGMPQVCDSCPVKNPKDHLLLHVGAEVYKVCPNPDALLPYLIKDNPSMPVVSNHRVNINANTAGGEEWISTGLYLSPGIRTYVALPAEIVNKGWQIQIGCQTDYLNASELKRPPCVHERFPVTSEMMQVWNLWGGLIYLVVPPNTQVEGAEVKVQMAVTAPYYKSGVTTAAEWSLLRTAPSPWAELEFDNIILTVPSDAVRNLERPDELAAHWNGIMKAIADLAAIPHKFPRKERFVTDVQISAGWMHSGYPIMAHTQSAAELVNTDVAKIKDMWGPIHELGHNQQRGCWEFSPHTTECTCNLWSVYVHEEVLGINRAKAHPEMTLANRNSRIKTYVQGGRKLNKWHVWVALETYMQLQEKFGWYAFKKVFAAYHKMSNFPKDNKGKMNLYAETFSKTVEMNLCGFFKAWGWPMEAATEEKLCSLPPWNDHPMTQYK